MGSADPGLIGSLESYERGLLGLCLLDGDSLADALELVGAEDFTSAYHRAVWSALARLVAAGTPVDLNTAADELARSTRVTEPHGGWRRLILDIAETPANPALLRHYCETIRRGAQLRDLAQLGEEISRQAGAGVAHDEAGVDGLLGETERRVMEITGRRCQQENPQAALHALDYVQEQLTGQPETGISTGLMDLDEHIEGLHPGRLYVVGSRPAVGKTTLGLQVALNVALGARRPITGEPYRVAFISLEMSVTEIYQRAISNLSGIPCARLRSDRASDHDIKLARREIGLLRDVAEQLVIAEFSNLTLPQLQHHARREQRRGTDLLVIDYLQLLRGPHSGNRVQEVSEITRTLKALATELRLPVLVLSQLSRAGTGDKPALHHLRESGSIEQDADVVLLLWREYEEDPHTPLICDVAKNRHGPTGPVKLAALRDTFKIGNSSPLGEVDHG